MEKVECNLCGSEQTKLLLSSIDWTFPTEERFSLVECSNCGLSFLNPRPTEDEIGKYYPDEYYERGEKNIGFDYLKPNRVKMIRKYCKEGKVLDIGCRHGEFLIDMRRYEYQPYGVEVSKIASEDAWESGLENVINENISEAKLAENFFDIVTLWHVLEHVHKPLAVLHKINRSIKKGGLLVIEVPNFASILGKFWRDKCYVLDIPRHLYQFTPRTLGELLKKTGFRITKISYLDNLFMNFVCFKLGILRWVGYSKPLETNLTKPLDAQNFKETWLRETIKFIFNTFCVIVSILLAFLRQSNIITVYCEKK